MILTTLAIVSLTGCYAVDGDTIVCAGQRYRLQGINAPEMPNHCRKRMECPPGDPFASKASLAAAMKHGPITFEYVQDGKWGRKSGFVYAGGRDLSCHQLRARQAKYKPNYDRGGRLKRCS